MKVMPNQVIAHRTPAEAWRWALKIIDTYGDRVITEDRKVTKEVRNLVVQILEPGEGWPIPGSGWDMPGLEKYAEQFLSGQNPTGFAYTYGQRLFRYPDTMTDLCNIDKHRAANYTDQIRVITERLRKNNSTRRANALTWIPWFDSYNAEVPCLQLVDFLFRDGKLHLSAIFRSWDVKQAAPANIYGLWRLLCYVAAEAGMEPGSLTIVAISAHIYEV